MDATIALIGFGEAASTFAGAGNWAGRAKAFDIKTMAANARTAMLAKIERAAVTPCEHLGEALSGATSALSLVTADQSLSVAETAAPSIAPGCFFFDMNSVAPQTKRAAEKLIASSGGHYVDVAIMGSVNPAQLSIPLLVSGVQADAAVTHLTMLGFSNVRNVGREVGRASMIKMLRSVMYKGVEALTAECLLACQKAGVTDEVLDSFANDWSTNADYRLERMMVHGQRRSAEMDEVVKTLELLGVDPLLSRGAAERQRNIGALTISPIPDGLTEKLEALLR